MKMLTLLLFPILSSAVMNEEDKIQRLLEFIKKQDKVVFIRNGSEHTSQEAYEHLKGKLYRARKIYSFFGYSIETAHEFIIKLASKSSISGKPYQIRYKDGTKENLKDILLKELGRIEEEQKSS